MPGFWPRHLIRTKIIALITVSIAACRLVKMWRMRLSVNMMRSTFPL